MPCFVDKALVRELVKIQAGKGRYHGTPLVVFQNEFSYRQVLKVDKLSLIIQTVYKIIDESVDFFPLLHWI